MKNSQILFILLLSIFACSEKEVPEPKYDTRVQLRLRNTSGFDYTDAQVGSAGSRFVYGKISPNESTGYHEFAYAYRYAYVSVIIDSVLHELQPIDFMGKKKLASGSYTYEINFNPDSPSSNKLTLKLVAD